MGHSAQNIKGNNSVKQELNQVPADLHLQVPY